MRGIIAEFFSQKHSMQLITAIDKVKLNPKIGDYSLKLEES
jgi:hypothetical protein